MSMYIIIGKVVSADAASSLSDVNLSTSVIILEHEIMASNFPTAVFELSMPSNASYYSQHTINC